MKVECDYCGELFDEDDRDPIALEQDECVCPECASSAYEQYRLSGEIKDDPEDYE